MKVLNLQCSHQHSFEGWFGSEDDFQTQLSRGLVECPLCTDSAIQKMPSAPRLNFGGHQGGNANSSGVNQTMPSASTAAGTSKNEVARNDQREFQKPDTMGHAAQAAFLKALRQVMASSEDVGLRFTDEARRMHYGEIDARSIRGQASAREVVDLLEEGIEIMPLPAALKETLQ